MRNVDRIKELEHELKRYEKAVKTRDIVINELKEEVAGHIQVEQMLGAYIAGFIEQSGGKVYINKAIVADMIKRSPKVVNTQHDVDYILELKYGEDV